MSAAVGGRQLPVMRRAPESPVFVKSWTAAGFCPDQRSFLDTLQRSTVETMLRRSSLARAIMPRPSSPEPGKQGNQNSQSSMLVEVGSQSPAA